MSQRILTNSNFQIFADTIASPSKPDEYCEASMERLMQYLNPYVEHVKNIRFKYHAVNKIELIPFSNREEQEAYDNAWEDYLKQQARLEERADYGESVGFMKMVVDNKFIQVAELIRAPYLARRLYDIRNGKNRSAICAVKHKETVAKIVNILVNDYNVQRNRISLIWGGQQAAKSKLSPDDSLKLKELFSSADYSFLSELGIEMNDEDEQKGELGDNSLIKQLGLGVQSKRQRQYEIDNFQSDKSDYCIFTFKSGGVGLSLHQEKPEYRQRESLLAPVYSAIELVQGLGRSARLTSCSDTEQTIVYYKNTIEVKVAERAKQKLRCLRKAVQKKESWDTLIRKRGDEINEEEETINEVEEDTDNLLAGGSPVDEEDNTTNQP